MAGLVESAAAADSRGACSLVSPSGARVAPVSAPIAPVVPEDDRRSVASLLEEQSEAMSEMRTLMAAEPLYNPARHDDLWMLRFVLSHVPKGGVASAARAAAACMKFRHENKLDDHDVRRDWPRHGTPSETYTQFRMHCADDASQHIVFDKDRGVVSIIVLKSLDMHGLATIPADGMRQHTRNFTEWLFQMCDATTRRTGLLTKTVRLVQMQGFKLAGFSRAFVKRDAQHAKEQEDYYPQLLASVYICHAPFWVQGTWRLMRPFFPSRFVAKMDMISPRTNDKEAKRLVRHVAMSDLPECFGGENASWPCCTEPGVEPGSWAGGEGAGAPG